MTDAIGVGGARTIRSGPSTSLPLRNASRPRRWRAAGRSLSLSRDFPKLPTGGNVYPAQHWMKIVPRGTGGFSADYYGIYYHGIASTHLDALCHTWDDQGMWNGRDPAREITFEGATFGSVEHWSTGIITRGVLLDVPNRGEPYVTLEKPVHGWELEDIAAAQGITLEPGDAVVVYSGREALQSLRASITTPRRLPGPLPYDPGLHASCLPFLRDNDVAVLVWDMMDLMPNGYDLPWSVHGAIFAYGIALLDNALLQPLAKCVPRKDATSSCCSSRRSKSWVGQARRQPIALF